MTALKKEQSDSTNAATARPMPAATPCQWALTAWMTAQEAAKAASVSIDTIKRDLKDKMYPGAEQRGTNNTWYIPVRDLLLAGRLRPDQVTEVADLNAVERVTLEAAELSSELAAITERLVAAQTTIALLEDSLEYQRVECEFLRRLLSEAHNLETVN